MPNCHLLWLSENQPIVDVIVAAMELTQHPHTSWKCGLRVLGLTEEASPPKANLMNFLWVGRMETWKYASFRSIVTNQSSDLIWDTTCLSVNILNLSRMTERFSWCRSKIGRNPPSCSGTLIDSLWASVLPKASLCNHAASIPPHYRSKQRRGRRGGPRMGLPTILKPRCGDRGRTAGSMLEVLPSLAKSVRSCVSPGTM